MTAAFLTLFLAFAACQAFLTVRLADWLSADETRGRGAAAAIPAEGYALLA